MPASKLLDYPYDVFLMVRFEFVAMCQDEMEAKLLRIIEKHVEVRRQTLFAEAVNTQHVSAKEEVAIDKDVWVTISYRLFRNDLYSTVSSDNTLKRYLKSLEKKKIIFIRYTPQHRYDAPEYRLNTSLMQPLLDIIKKPGYQSLIPSILDTLKHSGYQELTPSGYQELIASTVSRVSNFDTNITRDTNNKGNNNDNNSVDGAIAHQPDRTIPIASDDHQSIPDETEPEPMATGTTSIDIPMQSYSEQSSVAHNSVSQEIPAPCATNDGEVTQGKRRVRSSGKVPPPQWEELTPQEQCVIEEWRAIHTKKKIPLTQAFLSQVRQVVEYEPDPGEIRECRLWMFKTDKNNWHRENGLDLCHIASKITRFRSTKDAKVAQLRTVINDTTSMTGRPVLFTKPDEPEMQYTFAPRR